MKVLKNQLGDNKPLMDRLNKTGSALLKLVGDEDRDKVQELLDSDNGRFDTIKSNLREHTYMLDQALHQTSQVTHLSHTFYNISTCVEG